MVAHYQAAVGRLCSVAISAVALWLSVPGKRGDSHLLDPSPSASVLTSQLLASEACADRAILSGHCAFKLLIVNIGIL